MKEGTNIMAANKRYRIQVGDTVRIDPKKVVRLRNIDITLWRELDPKSRWSIPEMSANIGKQFVVKAMWKYEHGVAVKFNNDYFVYALAVCTKINK